MLLGQGSGGLGVLVPFISGEFFAEFLRGVDEVAHKEGFFLTVASTHRNMGEFKAALGGLARKVDGLLIMATELNSTVLEQLPLPGVPIVLVNTSAVNSPFDVFNFDNYQGSYDMASYLIKRGHRRIVLLCGPASSTDAHERLRGYRSALADHEIPHDPALEIPGDYSQEAGLAAGEVIVRMSNRPSAVLAANDQSAFGIIRAVSEAGLQVPGDLAIAGFDDIPLSSFMTPPLTTVRVPIREMGERAILRLRERIRQPDLPPEHITLPVEVVVRASA